MKLRPFQFGNFVLTVTVRWISVCLEVNSFFKDTQVAICWDRAVHHVGQFDTYRFMQTKFMYGINDSVHTTLCSKISLLVFTVHALFKVLAPFERTPPSSIFVLNILEDFRN